MNKFNEERYKIDLDSKNYAINLRKKMLILHFSIGGFSLSFAIVKAFHSVSVVWKILMIMGLLIGSFLSGKYFLHQHMEQLSNEYAIEDNMLVVYRNEERIKQLRLDRIRSIEKEYLGYVVKSYSGDIPILFGVNKVEELINKITP